jgi:hypothetical protein
MKKKLDSSQNLINQAEINELFSQITLREVEQFYKTYQLWSKHQDIARIQQELGILREKQAQNAIQMQSVTPSAVAFSTLTQLRASGVEDIDLLDRMLERGEEWLDHTMQLLERCEELNVIRGNYTQWCEHALDGAYEWMGSMDDASLHDYFHAEAVSEEMPLQALMDADPTDMVTEDQLLRKLMSEDETITKRNTVPLARITQDLPPLPVHEDEDTEDEIATDAKIAENVNSNDFPVEIEEPEAEASASADQEQALAEQQTYQEDTLPDKPDEHLEDLFPVEIEEPANATAEAVDQAQLLPTDANVDTEEHDLEEHVLNEEKIYATADQAEATTNTLTDTSIKTSDDEPVVLDEPATSDDESVVLGKPATSDDESVVPDETTTAAETAITPETTENSSIDEPVAEPAQIEPSDEPIMDTAINTQEEPSAQWPFVYQKIEDTTQQESAPNKISAPDDTVKKNSAQTKQTKKKPHYEASRKSIKKKGFFRQLRRLLARIFWR